MTALWGLAPLLLTLLTKIARDLIRLRHMRIRHECTERLARAARPGTRITFSEPDGSWVELSLVSALLDLEPVTGTPRTGSAGNDLG